MKISLLLEAYKNYIERDGGYSFGIYLDEFRHICSDFNRKASERIISESETLKMPFRLGSIRVRKRKLDVNRKINIDWEATKKYKKVIYHLNEHTDGYGYYFFHDRTEARFKNQGRSRFKAARANGRLLAKALKEKRTDYFL